MKKLILILFVAGFSIPAMAQSGDAYFFKRMSTKSSVHPTIKNASIGIFNNYYVVLGRSRLTN